MVNAEGDSRPAAPSWLDKNIFQRALQSGDEDSSVTVTSYEISMANAQGDGYLSNMYRVVVYLQDSQERRLIVKCKPLGGQREELLESLEAYTKETLMLSETLPAMFELLERARPGEYQPFTPKCLYHGTDPLQFIVMEDLREAGFTLAKRQYGLDLEHCSLAIKALARFHASSVALFDKDPQAVTCFKSPIREEGRQLIAPFYENALRSVANEASKWPGYEKFVPKLMNLVDTIYDRVLYFYTRRDDEFNVLCHGDTWSNNMMFKYSGDTLEDFRFVDVQLSYFCSPATDLQYFLYTTPSEEVRIKHMDSLLKEYHHTLTETLKTLDCTKYVISLQELEKIFEDFSFLGLIVSVSIMPVVISDPEHGLDVEEALSKDADTDGNNAAMYANEVYVKAMKRLLPFFDKQGLFE